MLLSNLKDTWNATVVSKDDRNATVEFSGKWVNYLGPDGNWAPINCNLIPTAEGWSVTEAPFNFNAPKFADDEAFFESDVRWDIFGQDAITDDPFGMYMRATQADHVEGELFDINGNGKTDAVIYKNAFPAWGADLIYYVRHGRAPRLEKLVRFNADPGVNAPTLDIDFDIRFTAPLTIKPMNDVLTSNDIKRTKVHTERRKSEEKKDTPQSRKKAFISLLDERESLRKVWSQKDRMRTLKSIMHRPNGASERRGIGMKDFIIWDSHTDVRNRKQSSIEVEYTKVTRDSYRLTKLVPTEFFDGAVFPVLTDTTLTFFPDAHVETTTVDGTVYSQGNGSLGKTWSDIRDDPGNNVEDSNTTIDVLVGGGTVASQYETLSRCIMLFDTTTIPVGSVKSSGTVTLRTETVSVESGASDAWGINICGSNPTSNTALASGDYANLVFTAYSATVIAVSGLSADTDEVWTLNASGLAAVTLGGITKFGVCFTEDIAGSGNYDQGSRVGTRGNFYSADQTGTDDDPTLSVVFTFTIDPPTSLAASVDDGSTTIDLTWTDNSSDEEGYDVEVSDTGSGGWSLVESIAANSTSYSHALGTNSTQKYYRVKATHATYGDSTFSSVVNATTASAAPSATAVAHSNGSTVLTVTWTDNSSDETGFSVERSDDGSSGWAEVGNVGAGITTYADDVATNGVRRYYRVKAQRSGDSVDSNYSATANNITAPAAPTPLTVDTSQGSQQLRVSWTDNSSTETTFSIERRKAGEAAFVEIVTDTASPYDDTGLDEDTLYFYRVRAYNATDTIYSAYTTVASARTLSPKPTNLRALPNEETSVMLLWDGVSTRSIGVKVERSLNDSDWSTLATTAKGALQYEDTGLTNGTTYYYRVSSVGPDGTSAATASVSVIANMATSAGMEFAINKKLNSFPTE